MLPCQRGRAAAMARDRAALGLGCFAFALTLQNGAASVSSLSTPSPSVSSTYSSVYPVGSPTIAFRVGSGAEVLNEPMMLPQSIDRQVVGLRPTQLRVGSTATPSSALVLPEPVPIVKRLVLVFSLIIPLMILFSIVCLMMPRRNDPLADHDPWSRHLVSHRPGQASASSNGYEPSRRRAPSPRQAADPIGRQQPRVDAADELSGSESESAQPAASAASVP